MVGRTRDYVRSRFLLSLLPLLSAFIYVLVRLMTFSYYPRLQNYTLRPIRSIAKHANNSGHVNKLLIKFRDKKQRDLDFVRASSTLSAIASITVFSWPVITHAFWLAKVFWYWSLTLSFFSLTSSTIDQLLEWIPSNSDPDISEDRRAAVLRLLVDMLPPDARAVGKIDDGVKARPRWVMVWVWQTPVMLMSWSWVMFYGGLLLHILTPVIPGDLKPSEVQVVATTMVGCGLPIVNFFVCATLTSCALQALRNTEDL